MFKTKKEAFEAARTLKAKGKTVKVFCHSGIATVPGRGIQPFIYYTVQAA